jgi:hypothetical protein
VKPLSSKDSKTKEERLFEMYVKAIIDETTFMQMWKRIKESKEQENKK